MITANVYNKTSLQAYHLMVILPRATKLGISHIGHDQESEPLKAYVNHGLWKVKCECGGCEKAWEEELFMCQSCLNSGHKHQYRQAIFPTARKSIEKLLALRPLANRNWTPGETLNQLKADNQEHRAELLEVR